MDLPQYTLKPNIKRVLVPNFFVLLFLGLFFYFALWLNFTLLNKELPDNINLLIVAILALLLVLQAVLSYMKFSKARYLFFADRIQYVTNKTKVIYFNQVRGISFKRNFIDKLFNCGTIRIEPGFEIKYVPNSNQIYVYIQQLIQSYKYNTQRI